MSTFTLCIIPEVADTQDSSQWNLSEMTVLYVPPTKCLLKVPFKLQRSIMLPSVQALKTIKAGN